MTKYIDLTKNNLYSRIRFCIKYSSLQNRPQLWNGRLQEHIANALKHQPLKPVSIFCTAELEQLKDPVFFKVRYVKDLQNRMPVETIETPEALVMFVKVTCDD